jgi:hypothetical protein
MGEPASNSDATDRGQVAALDTTGRRPYGAREMADRLRDLRTRLLDLHKLLLDDAREAWEADYGPVDGPELLQLALRHERFAWLRALSAMISRIDATLDETRGPLAEADVEDYFGQARALLRSGGDGPFETKYREALQRSADVVMAHAAVVKLFRTAPGRRSQA